MKLKDDEYSDVSDEFDDNDRPPIPHLPENKAVKPANKTVHSDDWPEVQLEDATITYPDGSIANLLNAALQGPFTIRGRIQVNEDSAQYLKHKKYNGRYIEVRNCTLYSISLPPFQVWAEGEGGWFEIIPSPKYCDTYKIMWEAVRMYYFVTEIYEKCLGKKKQLDDVDEIFYKWALMEGTGLVQGGDSNENVAERFKVHAEFLLGQIGRTGTLYSAKAKYRQSWLSTPFYRWLVKEVPDIQARYEQKADPSKIHPTTNGTELKQSMGTDTSGRDESKPMPLGGPLTVNSERLTVRKKQSKQSRTPDGSILGRNDSTPIVIDDSPDPNDTEEEDPNVEYKRMIIGTKLVRWRPHVRDQRPRDVRIMLKILEEGHASGKRPKYRQTMSTLGTQLYYDYGFGAPPMAHIVVRVNAKALLERLDDTWKDAPIYEDLKLELAGKRPPSTEKDNAYLRSIVPEYVVKARKKKEPKPDTPKAHGKVLNLKNQHGRKSGSGSQTPTISNINPLKTGLGSGKVPGLRLPGTSKRKLPPNASLLEMTCDDERELIEEAALSNLIPPPLDHPPKNPFSSRKRRRAFSPSQGHQRTPPPEGRPRPDLTAWNGEPDLPSPSVTPEPKTNGHTNHDPELPPPLVHKEKNELALVTTYNPSIEEQTTGPRRTFHCSHTNCQFAIDDAEDNPAVREKIRAHWRRHSEEIDRVQKDIEKELEIRRKGGQKNVESQASHLMEKIMNIGKGVREREGQLMAAAPGLFPDGGRTGGFAADGGQLKERIQRAAY